MFSNIPRLRRGLCIFQNGKGRGAEAKIEGVIKLNAVEKFESLEIKFFSNNDINVLYCCAASLEMRALFSFFGLGC